MTRLLIGICFLTMGGYAQAQTAGPVQKKISVKANASLAVDRLGNVYVVEARQVRKFDPNGRLLARTALRAAPRVWEPWNPLRVMAYDTASQTITWYDHHLKPIHNQEAGGPFAIEPCLVATTPDHQVWVMDRAERMIRRVDRQQRQASPEFPWPPDVVRPTFLREYQNLLFLVHDQSMITILNLTGAVIKKWQGTQIRALGFAGEDMYYLDGGVLHFFHLFSNDTQTVAVGPGVTSAVATDERLFLLTGRHLEIRSFRFE